MMPTASGPRGLLLVSYYLMASGVTVLSGRAKRRFDRWASVGRN